MSKQVLLLVCVCVCAFGWMPCLAAGSAAGGKAPASASHKKRWVKLPGPVTQAPPPIPPAPKPPPCQCKAALQSTQKRLSEATQKFGAESLQVAALYDEIGIIYLMSNQYQQSETSLKHAIDLKQRLHADPVDIAMSQVKLANLYRLMRNDAQCKKYEGIAAKTFDDYVAAHGEKSPIDVFIERGRLFLAEEKLDKAKEYYGRAVKAATDIYGARSPAVAHLCEISVPLYVNHMDYAQGTTLLKQAMDVRESLKLKPDATTLLAVNTQARLLALENKPREGTALMIRSLDDFNHRLFVPQREIYQDYITLLRQKKDGAQAQRLEDELKRCKFTKMPDNYGQWAQKSQAAH